MGVKEKECLRTNLDSAFKVADPMLDHKKMRITHKLN